MAAALTTNGAAILKRMKSRAVSVKRELSVAARELGPLLNGEAKRVLQAEIYNIQIPLTKGSDTGNRNRRALSKNSALRTKTTKGKHGQWMRTGQLKRAEGWAIDGPVIVLRNNAQYAAARNALGAANPPNKSGRMSGSQRSQPGVPSAQQSKTRSVQWHQVVIVKHRATILRVRREAVLRALLPGGK